MGQIHLLLALVPSIREQVEAEGRRQIRRDNNMNLRMSSVTTPSVFAFFVFLSFVFLSRVWVQRSTGAVEQNDGGVRKTLTCV